MSIKHVKQAINAQWQAMIQAGRIPVMEWKMANGDWFVVDINLPAHYSRKAANDNAKWERGDCANYLTFSFDQDNKPCFFDGCITGKHGFYKYPLDECLDSLDHYLQEISSNIIEGYLIPNGLYAEEE